MKRSDIVRNFSNLIALHNALEDHPLGVFANQLSRKYGIDYECAVIIGLVSVSHLNMQKWNFSTHSSSLSPGLYGAMEAPSAIGKSRIFNDLFGFLSAQFEQFTDGRLVKRHQIAPRNATYEQRQRASIYTPSNFSTNKEATPQGLRNSAARHHGINNLWADDGAMVNRVLYDPDQTALLLTAYNGGSRFDTERAVVDQYSRMTPRFTVLVFNLDGGTERFLEHSLGLTEGGLCSRFLLHKWRGGRPIERDIDGSAIRALSERLAQAIPDIDELLDWHELITIYFDEESCELIQHYVDVCREKRARARNDFEASVWGRSDMQAMKIAFNLQYFEREPEAGEYITAESVLRGIEIAKRFALYSIALAAESGVGDVKRMQRDEVRLWAKRRETFNFVDIKKSKRKSFTTEVCAEQGMSIADALVMALRTLIAEKLIVIVSGPESDLKKASFSYIGPK